MNEPKKEIEAKALITEKDYKRIISFLEKNTKFLKKVWKNDEMFWKNNNPIDAFRIRKINNEYIITRKKREITPEGIEINEEIEFPIIHLEGFKQMMKSLGYVLWYQKQKNIQQYSQNNILYELVEIPDLGTFLEIETLSNDTKYGTVCIQEIFTTLGLKIEPRAYVQILEKN